MDPIVGGMTPNKHLDPRQDMIPEIAPYDLQRLGTPEAIDRASASGASPTFNVHHFSP